MENVDPAQLGGWHLDKRVPITLISAIFIQTCGLVWWAATTDARVDNVEDHVSELQAAATELRREVDLQGREDVSISQQLSATNAGLKLLRDDVRETNALLRSMLQNGIGNGNGGHAP